MAPSADHVLLFLTDSSLAESLRSLLAGAGYDVSVCASMEETMAVLNARGACVLILWGDPASAANGSELMEIKAVPGGRRARLMMLTNADVTESARFLDLGADDAVALSAGGIRWLLLCTTSMLVRPSLIGRWRSIPISPRLGKTAAG